MNSREKFILASDRNVQYFNYKVEYSYWGGTIRRWFKEGLDKKYEIPEEVSNMDLLRASKPLFREEIVEKNVAESLGLDWYLSKFPFNISPMLKKEILEINDRYKIVKDEFGVVQKTFKTNESVPHCLDFPIKNKEDFYSYRDLYNLDFSKRLPRNWEKLIKELQNRDFPIRLGGHPFGFCGLPRHLMGDVCYMYGLYDNPDLIKSINKFFLDFVMNYWSTIMRDVEIDCVIIWEDMAYRSGSFISKDMFKEFVSPYYIEFIDFLKQFKIRNIVVDCDGLVEELIPIWVELGITGIFPFERNNNLLKVRERYPTLKIFGGVDKRVLIEGNLDAINRELELISNLLKKGGFIPHIDHAVPMDIEWSIFKYYRERLNKIIDSI